MPPPERRALLIGIDKYKYISGLSGAASDARKLAEVLGTHEGDAPNYACETMTYEGNDGETLPTRSTVREQLERLFDYRGEVLFYFAGHGMPTEIGGYFCTWDSDKYDIGIPMSELLQRANESKAEQVLLVLDCCFSGNVGNAQVGGAPIAQLREGVTILTASQPTQKATEIAGKGIFTELLIGALTGGAADVRGEVSAAAIYAYIEQALGPWDQRPMYKSHASKLSPVRRCAPKVEDALLRRLPKLFPKGTHQLDPSYEHTHPTAKKENVALFNAFKILRNAGLLQTKKDLYYTALDSELAELTPLGLHYRRLAEKKFI